MRPAGRAVWVIVAVLVAALGVGVVWDQRRSDQSAPAPTPSPTQTPSTRSVPTSPPSAQSPSPSGPITLRREQTAGEDRLLAEDLPPGALYARSSDHLYAINTRTGATVVTPIQTATTDAVAMVPTHDGVAIRPSDDTAGLLVRDGRSPVDLPGQLKTADDLLPGPPGRVWVLKRVDDYASFDTTATLVDSRGRRDGPRITAAGSYASDGAGGLLLTDVGGTWQTYPQPLKRVTGGNVTSVGAHHYQLLDCDNQHRCTETLLNRRNGQRTPLLGRERSYSNSLISPDGTFRASLDGFGNTRPQTTITRVADHRILQRLPEPAKPATSLPGSIVWLSERYLTAISNGHLTLYDTTHDSVTTPDLPAGDLLQLSWRPN